MQRNNWLCYALNLKWSIFTKKLSVDVTFGPTQIIEYGGFETASLNLFDNWFEFSFDYKIKVIRIFEFILVETFDALRLDLRKAISSQAE